MRLQALVRSRLLTHRFTLLRSKMITLQRHCRSYFARTYFERRQTNVLILQAGIRKMIAQRKYMRAKIFVSNQIVMTAKLFTRLSRPSIIIGRIVLFAHIIVYCHTYYAVVTLSAYSILDTVHSVLLFI